MRTDNHTLPTSSEENHLCLCHLFLPKTQAAAVACGQLTIPRDRYNYTLSITSAASLECKQLAAAAAAGAQVQPNCARCAALTADTAYTVLVVARAGDASSDVVAVAVSAGVV